MKLLWELTEKKGGSSFHPKLTEEKRDLIHMNHGVRVVLQVSHIHKVRVWKLKEQISYRYSFWQLSRLHCKTTITHDGYYGTGSEQAC